MQQNNINNLIINKMTQAQYDTITPASDELYFITDGVIQSSDVINALGYIPANNTNIDGAWTFPSSSITICSKLSVNGSGTENFALNTVLPNDGNLYEMILSCHGETGTASGNRVQLMLSSSNTFVGDMQIFDVIARSAARVFGGGTIMFPAKSTTTLKVTKNSAYTGTVTISCLAYRKVR